MESVGEGKVLHRPPCLTISLASTTTLTTLQASNPNSLPMTVFLLSQPNKLWLVPNQWKLRASLYPLISVPCHPHRLSIPAQVTDSLASFFFMLWQHLMASFSDKYRYFDTFESGQNAFSCILYPQITHTHIFICFPATHYKCHSVPEIFNQPLFQFERQVGIIWSAILSRYNSPGY